MMTVLMTIFDLIWMGAAGVAFIRFVAFPVLDAMNANRRRLRRQVSGYWFRNRFN